MALIFCDGFDHVDDGFGGLKWDTVSAYLTYVAGVGRGGGWGMSNTIAGYQTTKTFSARSTVILGMAVSTPLADTEFIIFSANGTPQLQFSLTVAGNIAVHRGYDWSPLLGTTDPVITTDTWQYLEIKVVFSQTVGSVEIRVDGVTVMSLTGVDTCNTDVEFADSVSIYAVASASPTYCDDLYLCDDSGTECNDFLGDVKITTLYPTADGTHTDFTPSTGTDHYALVDDPQYISTTGDTYVSSSSAGHKDTFDMGTFSGAGTIHAVQVSAAVKNADTGTITVKPLCRSGATPADNEGDGFAVSQTIKAASTIWEKEPTDDAAWTADKVNAAEFGLKIES